MSVLDDVTIGMKVADGTLADSELLDVHLWFKENQWHAGSVQWMLRGGEGMQKFLNERFGWSHKANIEGAIVDTAYDGHPNPELMKDLERVMISQAAQVVASLEKMDRQAGKDAYAMRTLTDPYPDFTGNQSANSRQIAAKSNKEEQIATKASLTESNLDLVLPAEGFDEWEEEISEVMNTGLREVVRLNGEAAITVAQGLSFDLGNDRVQRYLSDESRRIGRSATDTYRKEIRKQLLAGMAEGESTAQIAKRIEQLGDRFVPWKANQIARTETAFASTAGTIEGWKQSGVVVGKQYVLAPNACPWCEAVAAQFGSGRDPEKDITVDLDKPFYALGSQLAADFDGTTRHMNIDYVDLQGPPIHPHCRCSIRPVIQEA